MEKIVKFQKMLWLLEKAGEHRLTSNQFIEYIKIYFKLRKRETAITYFKQLENLQYITEKTPNLYDITYCEEVKK